MCNETYNLKLTWIFVHSIYVQKSCIIEDATIVYATIVMYFLLKLIFVYVFD